MARLLALAIMMAGLHAGTAGLAADARPGLGGWASRSAAALGQGAASSPPGWGVAAATPVDYGDGVTWGAGRVLRAGW